MNFILCRSFDFYLDLLSISGFAKKKSDVHNHKAI